MLAAQQLVDQRKKSSRLSALNDAVIVGAGDGHHLADADARERFGRHRLIFGRIFDRAGCDDHALARHQRGFEAVVPIVPGLVKLIVVP